MSLSPRPAAAAALPSDSLPAVGVQRFQKTFRALANREFRYLWIGTLGGFTAMQLQMVAFGYVAYLLTGSAVVLGLVSLGGGVVQTICGLFSGAIVDRLPKRRLVLISQSALGAIALANLVLVLGGVLEVWQLFLVALAQGAVFAFNMPGRQAFIAHLARSPAELHNAIALHNTAMNLTRVLGPAVAGGILSLPGVGVPLVFSGIAVCYLWTLLSFLLIRNPGAVQERRQSSILGDLTEGWRYIGRTPVLRALLLLSFASTLLGMPFQILMPVFAVGVFHVGATGLGLMLAATGLGALAGALATAYLSDSNRKGAFLFAVCLIFGLAIAAFALSPSVWLALPALVVAGGGSSIVLSLSNGLLVANSSGEMHGRVMSAYMISFALFPLGVLPAGTLADHIGAQPAIAGGGLLFSLTILALYLLNPSLRRLR